MNQHRPLHLMSERKGHSFTVIYAQRDNILTEKNYIWKYALLYSQDFKLFFLRSQIIGSTAYADSCMFGTQCVSYMSDSVLSG